MIYIKWILMQVKIFLLILVFINFAFAQSDQLLNDSGLVYYYKNQFKLALKEFEAALKINPNNFEVYYNIGRTYYQMNNLKEAENALKKAIELKPNYIAAKNLLKKIQSEINTDKEQKANLFTFSKKVKIQLPNELSYPYDDYTEGLYAYYSGNRALAKEKFDNDIKDKSKEEHVLMDQAVISYHQRNFDEAITYFKKLVDKYPNNINAKYNLALCYEQISKVDEAINIYNEIYKTFPSFTMAYERYKMLKENTIMNLINLADSYFNKKDWNKAIETYQTVKKYALPNSEEYIKADSNIRIAKLELEKKAEIKSKINQGFLNRNIDFNEANSNPSRYLNNIVTWKGRIFKIEKYGNLTDILVIYLPNFLSNVDITEYFKESLFVVRINKNIKLNEIISEEGNITVTGKIIGSEQLKNAFKYNTYSEKIILEPLKFTATHKNYSGEYTWENVD